MKKIYFIFLFTVFNLNAGNDVTLEVLPSTNSTDCNNNIKVKIYTDNPGDPYAGPNSIYDFWSITLKLDNSIVFFTKVGSQVFVPPTGNGRYYYIFTANVNKSLQGNLVNATVERTTYIGTSITFTQGKFYSNEYDWCSQSSEDIDGDGVPNITDRCPNTFGNQSNLGCPGNPDLVVDKKNTYEISDCNACNGPLENVEEGYYRPVIYRYGGNLTLNPLAIKNIGDGIHPLSPALKISFYLSKDKNKSNDDIEFKNRYIFINAPGPGKSTADYSKKYGVSIEGSDIGNKVPYGNYYILIVIDDANAYGDSEQNKDNNVSSVPIKYTNKLPTIDKHDDEFEIDELKYNRIFSVTKPQELNIYRFNGKFIKKVTIKSDDDKKKVLSKLPKGLYILNGNNGSSEKIYVDN